MKTINQYIVDFLEYSEIEKGNSILTAQNYDRYLRRFSGFAKQNDADTPDKITPELIKKYRLWLNRLPDLAKKETISKSTQNYHLIALRAFLKYLGSHQIETLSPQRIELAKTGQRAISFLKDEEMDSLFSKPDLKTIQGLRDRAILDLFFSTGLRISELCKLKLEDVNLQKNEFSVKGKGNKIRVVFLDDNAKRSLRAYLSKRNDKLPFLFVSYGHSNREKVVTDLKAETGMTPRSIQRMIKKYARMAGLTKKVTPHVLRHSFATDLLMSGADIRSVQQLLGHSSITTTQIYTHITDRHLAEVHQAFHGLRRNEEPAEPANAD